MYDKIKNVGTIEENDFDQNDQNVVDKVVKIEKESRNNGRIDVESVRIDQKVNHSSDIQSPLQSEKVVAPGKVVVRSGKSRNIKSPRLRIMSGISPFGVKKIKTGQRSPKSDKKLSLKLNLSTDSPFNKNNKKSVVKRIKGNKTDVSMGKSKCKSIANYFEEIAKEDTRKKDDVGLEIDRKTVKIITADTKEVNVKERVNAFKILMQSGGVTRQKTPVKSMKRLGKDTNSKKKIPKAE